MILFQRRLSYKTVMENSAQFIGFFLFVVVVSPLQAWPMIGRGSVNAGGERGTLETMRPHAEERTVSRREEDSEEGTPEELQEELENFIQETATIKVAGRSLGQREEVKNFLKRLYPEIDPELLESPEGIKTLFEQALLDQTRLELAAKWKTQQQEAAESAKRDVLSLEQKEDTLRESVPAVRGMTRKELVDLAEKADVKAASLWEKAAFLLENNGRFWDQWEEAVEGAKEALHSWEEVLHSSLEEGGERAAPSNLVEEAFKHAEERKAFWGQQLEEARVAPPLTLEEKQEAVLEEKTSEIPLPLTDEGDQERLDLLREIETLTATQQSQQKDSILPETRLRCSSSVADYFPMERDLNQKLRPLYQKYYELAEAADKRRIQQEQASGLEPHYFPEDKKALRRSWKNRDRELLRQEESALAKQAKEARQLRLGEDWKRNTRRWAVLARADELGEQLHEWQHYYTYRNKNKTAEEERWEEEQEPVEEAIQQLEIEHKALSEAWKHLAFQHPGIEKIIEEEGSLAAAEKSLKKSDRVIIEFQREFNDQVYQGVTHLRTRVREVFPQEIEACKKAIANWREDLLQRLKESSLPFEKLANSYRKALKKEALKDARADIPGDREAYEYQAKESARKAEELKNSQKEREERHLLDFLAQVHAEALQTWQQERQYLEDVQQQWKDQLEELAERRQQAAAAYFKDHRLPWIMLTPQERYYYNAPIRKARLEQAPKDLQEALEQLEQAYEEVRRTQHSFTSFNAQKEKAEREKQEAYQKVKKLLKHQIEEARQNSIATYQEVERLHDPKIQSIFSGPSPKAKEKALADYIKASSSLLELEESLERQERKWEYEENQIPLIEQKEREDLMCQKRSKTKEWYLRWIRLTPPEKKRKIKEIEEALGESNYPVSYYKRAAEAEREGNIKVAWIYLDAGEAREAQAAALKRGDKETAEIQNEIARALGGYAFPLWEIREKQMELLKQGDMGRAAIGQLIDNQRGWQMLSCMRSVYNSAADYYNFAAKVEKTQFKEISKLYAQAGEAREAQVAALKRGNEAIAKIQRQIAVVLGEYAEENFSYEVQKLGSRHCIGLRDIKDVTQAQNSEVREAEISALKEELARLERTSRATTTL